MAVFWTSLKGVVAVIVAALASTSYVGVSATVFEINGMGVVAPLYRTVTVTNIGPERVRFTVSGNVPWMSVGREHLPVATTIQLAPREAVNFIIEVHPQLVPGDSANNVITVTAADPRDGSVLDAATIGVRLLKRHQPTPLVTTTVSPTVRSTPSFQPEIVVPTAHPIPKITPKQRLPRHAAPSRIPHVTSRPTSVPSPSARPIMPRQSRWQSFINRFGGLFD